MTVIVCPTFDTPTEAVDWLAARGCTTFHLWRGPDGKVRGHGLKDVDVPGLSWTA